MVRPRIPRHVRPVCLPATAEGGMHVVIFPRKRNAGRATGRGAETKDGELFPRPRIVDAETGAAVDLGTPRPAAVTIAQWSGSHSCSGGGLWRLRW
jgi:hypothetical protein